jgi:hypothetical protein
MQDASTSRSFRSPTSFSRCWRHPSCAGWNAIPSSDTSTSTAGFPAATFRTTSHIDLVVTNEDPGEREDWRGDFLWSAQPTARSCRLVWRGFGMAGAKLSPVEAQQISLFAASLRTFHRDVAILSMTLEDCHLDTEELFRYILHPLQAYNIPAINLRNSAIVHSYGPPGFKSARVVLQLGVCGFDDYISAADVRALYQAFPNLEQLSLQYIDDAFWLGLGHLASLKHLVYEHFGWDRTHELLYEHFARLTTLKTLEVLDTVCVDENSSEAALLILPATLTRLSLSCDEDFVFPLRRLLAESSFLPALRALNLHSNGVDALASFEEAAAPISAICKTRSIVFTQEKSIFDMWVA